MSKFSEQPTVSSMDDDDYFLIDVNPITSSSTSKVTKANALPTKVDGPSSATDNAVARFDGTTGKLIQNSGAGLDDNANLTLTTPSGTLDSKGGFNLTHTNGTGTSQYKISQDDSDLLRIKRTGDTTGDGAVYSLLEIASPTEDALGDSEATLSLTTQRVPPGGVARTLDVYNDAYSRDNGMGMRQLYKNSTPNPIRWEFHDKTTNNGAWTMTGAAFTSGSPNGSYTSSSGVTPSADDWIWDNAGTYMADDTKLISINTTSKTFVMNRNATASGSGLSIRGKNIKEVMRLGPNKQLLVRKPIPSSNTTVAEFGGDITVDGSIEVRDRGGQVFNIKAYGAIADGILLLDGAISSSTSSLTSISANFTSSDVGKRVTVVGAATSNASLNTTISAFVSSTQVTLATAASTTVSGARVWYGTDNQTALNSVIAAIKSAVGGILFIPSGKYLSTNSSTIDFSGLIVRGAGIEATQLVVSSSTNPFFNVDPSGNGAISHITFENLSIDCTNQSSASGIVYKGGTYSSGDSLSYPVVRFCKITNVGSTSSGAFGVVLYSGRSTTDRGPVKHITCNNCIFDGSKNKFFHLESGQFEDVEIYSCRFLNGEQSSISWNQPFKSQTGIADALESAGQRSNIQMNIHDCTFNNPNKQQSDIRDINKTGFRIFTVKNCTFYPDNGGLGLNSYCIDVQGGNWGMKIVNNTFWKASKILSIGQSNNGPWFQTNPSQMTEISGNAFYKSFQVNDPDSDCYATWHNNTFVETSSNPLGGEYGRHWGERWHDNIIYNCNTASDGSTINAANSAIVTAMNGITVERNLIMDDRKLPDPTTVPVLSQVSGGSLSARTYYVKYTWINDTGETLASSEANISVSANNLLKITHPYTSTYGPPTGAKRINWYVSTTTNIETLQGYSWLPWSEEYELYTFTQGAISWTEPTSGLVSGTSLPVTNTTKQLTMTGIYEVSGGSLLYPNRYIGNEFRGINGNEVYSNGSTYKRIQLRNLTTRDITSFNQPVSVLEIIPYDQGNVSGATTFNVWNGSTISCTFTGNTTATVSSGHFVGQRLRRLFTMGGTGSYTYTKASNEKLVGGSFIPSTSVGSLDMLEQEWDGTYWIEIPGGRSKGLA